MGLSVIVTIGPHPAYKQFLDECIDSIYAQNISDDEIILVDDAAHISPRWIAKHSAVVRVIKNPWNLGQAASLNIGIAEASNDLIFTMGGCDDRLLPNCLQQCMVEYNRRQNLWACYSPMLITSEGETSTLPQGAWLFHRSMWAALGGYPKDAISEVDAVFASIMLKHKVVMYDVGRQPLYWHREHEHALTATRSELRIAAAGIIRGMCTQEWAAPDWIKGYGFTPHGS